MKRSKIPVYDLHAIERTAKNNLVVQRFDEYIKQHYEHLHRPHRHTFYHLVLFTAGSGSHTIDFQTYDVKPYQIYCMAPGQVHSWHFDENVNGYLVHFEEELFTAFLADPHYLGRFNFLQGSAASAVCQLPENIHGSVKALFESLLYESASDQQEHLDMVRLRLLELFIIIERCCGQPRTNPIAQHKTTLLRSYQNLIEKHYRELRLPKQYADLLYITPNHLNALCQDLLGKTAGDLIRDRILLEAKRMLTSADMTVTEIAYNLNFKDNSYFNRFFKKEVGTTPDDFRTAFLQT
ncbi:MAG: helix-turn-helix domain-containing protein [Chitinophagaceae bacterium]|nr:MAG: helix-turn-helix domain-containing protein [Chitinophagaceae bacterium]